MKTQRFTFIILIAVVFFLGLEFVRKSFSAGKTTKKMTKTEKNSPKSTLFLKADSIENEEKMSVADSIARTYAPVVFRDKQMEFARVKTAYKEKSRKIRALYDSLKLDYNSLNIYIRAFKKEEVVEVWAKDKSHTTYSLLATYKFCKSSGKLGPKRREGDLQIPEGFYHIDRFNPTSKFYLSLGLNYPNKIDKILADTTNKLGTDIFIHGNCVTVGCIPITDDKIKELYMMAVDARATGQKKIPVTIFPAKLSDANYKLLKTEFADQPKLLKFWKGLKDGYQQFEKCKKLPDVIQTSNGEYKCTSSCN